MTDARRDGKSEREGDKSFHSDSIHRRHRDRKEHVKREKSQKERGGGGGVNSSVALVDCAVFTERHSEGKCV